MAVADFGFRPIDPFAFWPGRSSALVQRPDEATGSPDYVFHSAYVDQASGSFEFRGHFENLRGAAGDLHVRVHELPQQGDAHATCIVNRLIPLGDIVAAGGVFRVDAEARDGCRYAILATLAPGASGLSTGLSITTSGVRTEEIFRERLIESRIRIFERPPLYEGLYSLEMSEPTLAKPVSQACTVSQFEEPTYRRWVDAIKQHPARHRKQWEFAYILAALDHYGALRQGARGLGFGVGTEPLPALMASKGCEITATDLSPDDMRASAWSDTGQHAANLAGIRRPDLISDDELERRVTFRSVDMNHIPDDLTGYDFTWSSCAFEHVGSVAAGLDFVERSIDCLRPGGIAVHTTELNLLSNDETLDHAGTVLFRRRDFEEIAARLTSKGHLVMPLNFQMGGAPLDDHFDVPPYSADVHFKLVIAQYVSTSYGIVVRRRS